VPFIQTKYAEIVSCCNSRPVEIGKNFRTWAVAGLQWRRNAHCIRQHQAALRGIALL
jgi:hypothetical protein